MSYKSFNQSGAISFHNDNGDITKNIVTPKLSFPVALIIHKCFSQPLHCPSQWAANGHKTLFRIIGHDSQVT